MVIWAPRQWFHGRKSWLTHSSQETEREKEASKNTASQGTSRPLWLSSWPLDLSLLARSADPLTNRAHHWNPLTWKPCLWTHKISSPIENFLLLPQTICPSSLLFQFFVPYSGWELPLPCTGLRLGTENALKVRKSLEVRQWYTADPLAFTFC